MTQDSNAPHDEYQCRPEVCGGIHYDPCTAASRGGVAVTTYVVTDGPKMLRETLCAAQVAIGDTYHTDPRIHEHMDRLQRLIDALPERAES